MNWISAMYLQNVRAEQAEQRRRLSASWGPLWTRRSRRPDAGRTARPGRVVRLPAARRPDDERVGGTRRDAA